MRLTALQLVYAALAVIGLLVTWYWNIQFMVAHDGFALIDFLAHCYANAASTSVTNDIVVVLVAFAVWSFFEARRLRMRHWWVYVVLALAVALAFAFPLFLLLRDRRLAALGDG